MWINYVIEFFQYLVFTYIGIFVAGSTTLSIMAFINLRRYREQFTKKEDKNLKASPYAPGISIVAPAYNEEKTIILNVRTMLSLDYPNYEVVIVNDGSKDKTLELLTEEFKLVEVPFAYMEKIKTKPFKRVLKSTDPRFEKLTVVDKENGGTKADASNAGVNASKHPYYLCTDVDCVLTRDSLTKLIQPVLSSSVQVIAVGATMRMVNSCELDENGTLVKERPPKKLIPRFQELEYLRSYLISKMGWAYINAVPNVSGGLGLFDKSVAIAAGGYDPLSHAEDMDMTLRMVGYMRDFNKEYRIVQIPATVCFTEGPPNVSVLNRQRTRWGRGLLQIFTDHRRFLFSRKYGRVSLILMPYVMMFELLAPVIEATGILSMLYLIITRQVNYNTFYILLLYIYLLGLAITTLAITFDLKTAKRYDKYRRYFGLVLLSLVEFLLYHPLLVFFSLKGYYDFLSKQSFEWGTMKRQGFSQVKQKGAPTNEQQPTGSTDGAPVTVAAATLTPSTT